MNTDRLIDMANDIARNLEHDADAPARFAEHLEKFWAPRMRQQLEGALRADPRAALPTVLAALAKT